MVVKVRVFKRTARVTGPEQIEGIVESVQEQANAFLSTLSINNVCDVRENLLPVGKDNSFTTFFITVYYLE